MSKNITKTLVFSLFAVSSIHAQSITSNCSVTFNDLIYLTRNVEKKSEANIPVINNSGSMITLGNVYKAPYQVTQSIIDSMNSKNKNNQVPKLSFTLKDKSILNLYTDGFSTLETPDSYTKKLPEYNNVIKMNSHVSLADGDISEGYTFYFGLQVGLTGTKKVIRLPLANTPSNKTLYSANVVISDQQLVSTSLRTNNNLSLEKTVAHNLFSALKIDCVIK